MVVRSVASTLKFKGDSTFNGSSSLKGSLALGSCQSSAYLTTVITLSDMLKSALNWKQYCVHRGDSCQCCQLLLQLKTVPLETCQVCRDGMWVSVGMTISLIQETVVKCFSFPCWCFQEELSFIQWLQDLSVNIRIIIRALGFCFRVFLTVIEQISTAVTCLTFY